MYFHIILTDDCNLCCRSCRAKAFEAEDEGGADAVPVEIDENLAPDLDYDPALLYRFLARDPAPTVTFYGGEPLLRPALIERIVREAPVQRFMIQTNGLLLDRLAPAIVNRFSTILVSLDGREALTDENRGAGVFSRVMANVKKIRSNGYSGELIARMTVTERTDIFDAVRYLTENPEYSFTSIHWQLDANFTHDLSRRSFAEWVRKCYNPGIRALVALWVDNMEQNGQVRRWYPFIDPMEDFLYGEGKPPAMRGGTCKLCDHDRRPYCSLPGYDRYEAVLCRPHQGCRSAKPAPDRGGRRVHDMPHKDVLWRAVPLLRHHAALEPGRRQLVCGTVENLRDALTDALPRSGP